MSSLEKPARDKHSCLYSTFVSYEENEVLLIWSLSVKYPECCNYTYCVKMYHSERHDASTKATIFTDLQIEWFEVSIKASLKITRITIMMIPDR